MRGRFLLCFNPSAFVGWTQYVWIFIVWWIWRGWRLYQLDFLIKSHHTSSRSNVLSNWLYMYSVCRKLKNIIMQNRQHHIGENIMRGLSLALISKTPINNMLGFTICNQKCTKTKQTGNGLTCTQTSSNTEYQHVFFFSHPHIFRQLRRAKLPIPFNVHTFSLANYLSIRKNGTVFFEVWGENIPALTNEEPDHYFIIRIWFIYRSIISYVHIDSWKADR